MDNIIAKTQKYISTILGLEIEPLGWAGVSQLPSFLTDTYDFFQVEILNDQFLLMVEKDVKPTPGRVRKHIDQVKKVWDGDVIYVGGIANSYDRRRFIDHKISFIVPGNQMYLPLLRLDLRGHFKKISEEKS